jgi:hypothetical protein
MASATTDRRLGLAGNTAFKTPATVISTANVTQSGEQTIDTVALKAVNAAGVPDRVLCTGQTDATTNGLWDVQTSAWTRSIDSNGNYDWAQGTQIIIASGTRAFQIWTLTTANPITVGTTALTFSQSLSAGFLATFAASAGATLVGWIQSGVNAVARTVSSKLSEWFSVNDFSGANVTAKLDSAITAAAGNIVLIPASVGAGEPTTWPNSSVALDMRGANAVGAGRKVALNLSDANGQNLMSVVNDLTNYTLSSAAGLFLARGNTGSIPNNRNIEGIQAIADLAGALTGGGSGFILCAAENDVGITSTGASIGFAWGASYSVSIGVAATTTVGEVAGFRVIGITNSSAVTPTLMFGGIIDAPTGNATRKGSLYTKGDVMIGGIEAMDAAAPTIASANTIAPTKKITIISGVAVIKTITPPSIMNGFAGQITLIPTGNWTTDTTGNIALASAAVTGKAMVMTYAAGAWYPSY